jgi:ParB family chromosome partitioning protein
MLDVDCMEPNPRQPRKRMEREALEELASSIRTEGIIQPLLVRSAATPGRYESIAGERRWRAAKMAGLREVPAYVREMSDQDVMVAALVENLQREDLNPAEEARALQELKERLSLTQEELAQRLGKSRSMVANALRLLQLPESALESLEEGAISAGHARCLLSLAPDEAGMAAFLARILANKLSVRDCEDAVAHWKKHGSLPWSEEGTDPRATPARRRKSPEFKQLEKSLAALLKVKASLSGTPDKGRISLAFASGDELLRLLGLLGLKDANETNDADDANEVKNEPDEPDDAGGESGETA